MITATFSVTWLAMPTSAPAKQRRGPAEDARTLTMSACARAYGIGRDRIRADVRAKRLPARVIGRAVKVSAKYAEILYGTKA